MSEAAKRIEAGLRYYRNAKVFSCRRLYAKPFDNVKECTPPPSGPGNQDVSRPPAMGFEPLHRVAGNAEGAVTGTEANVQSQTDPAGPFYVVDTVETRIRVSATEAYRIPHKASRVRLP